MGQVTIDQAAELLARGGPDKELHKEIIRRELLQVAEAGSIEAEKVAPMGHPMLVVGGDGEANARRSMLTQR